MSRAEQMVRIPLSRLMALSRDLRDLATSDYPVTPIADDAILQVFCDNGEPALGGAGATFTTEQALKTGRELLALVPVDPVEVERLRAELADSDRAFMAVSTKLAERDALLARVVNSGALSSEQHEELESECCALSSSSPKCKTCHDQGEVFVRKGDARYGMQTEPEPIMAECPDCAAPTVALSASAEPSALPDPLGCSECAHADCGKFDGPRQVECRAMADNACARPSASS